MQFKKFGLALVFLASTLAITGCMDDKPGDKITAPTIRKIADQDLKEGIEIADFKRSNGQVEPNSANLYKVTYSYNLRLTKPVAEVVLALGKSFQETRAESAKKETGGFFDAIALQNRLINRQLAMNANQWVNNQGDAFSARRDEFFGQCAPCLAYWNSDDEPKRAASRRENMVLAWIEIEKLGFKDTAKVGHTVPREAWASFTKTEQGWKPAD